MPYTKKEINNIRQLAASTDEKNVLLALEICKVRGITPELITAVYWMYNFLAWNEEFQQRFECYDLIEDYWRPTHQIKTIARLFQTPFIQRTTLRFHHLVLLQNKKWQLDWQWLSDTIVLHFKIQQLDFFVRKFILKNCSEDAKNSILKQLIQKNHLGQQSLDLGGLNLEVMPDFLPEFESVQILKLWGNNLRSLPDNWDLFQQLEELNLAENKLNSLPPSMSQLGNLKKLYINNNNWSSEQTIIDLILQMPQLEYINLANHQKETINPKFVQLESLINQGRLQTENSSYKTLVNLVFGTEETQQKLHWTNLIALLTDHHDFVRDLAIAQLKPWISKIDIIPSQATISVLGEISFHTRTYLEQLEQRDIEIVTEIQETTTHILLGNEPDISAVDVHKNYVLLLEEAL